jgi:hypothetical protein
MSNNIVDFNAVRAKRIQDRMDELGEEQEIVENFAGDFALNAMMDVVEALEEMDVDLFEDPNCIKDILAGVESIRAIIMRSHGEQTEFQKVTDKVFDNIKEPEKALSNFLNEFSN